MDPGQLASLAMLAGLIVDKALARFNVNLYDGVKRLHCGCSSCMDIDIDRSACTPPTSPISVSGPIEPAIVPAPPPPTTPHRESTPTVEELMRRVSAALVEPQSLILGKSDLHKDEGHGADA